MPYIDAVVDCPVFDSFRVQQIGGMFDVPLAERAEARFQVEVPGPDEDWKIGVIVGPSGSGKSTIARQAFGKELYQRRDWPRDRAVVDGFGDSPIKKITGLLTAVGFSSPPAWVKPYHVLSNGEQFRCDLARALSAAMLGHRPTMIDLNNPQSAIGNQQCPQVAFDEFTSVVDRNVARAASAAIAKGIRGGSIGARFVAATCHYDVLPWLEPDWIVDMATATLDRRRLRRPQIELRVFRCRHAAWRLFARHHYLNGELSRSARCFLALWDQNAVAFCATLPIIGRRKHWRITRVVCLPDYQGLGIGMRLAETVAELHRRDGDRVNVTAGHPAMIAHCIRSPLWRTVRVSQAGSSRRAAFVHNYRSRGARTVVSFEYLGQGSGIRGQ